jgi:hypothetical protein
MRTTGIVSGVEKNPSWEESFVTWLKQFALALACSIAVATTVRADEAPGPLVINDDINQKLNLDCAGRPVTIKARLSEITLTGNCGPLEVVGPQNNIKVDATPLITVTNFGNSIRWINKVNDKAPRIKDEGTFNSIKQLKPDAPQ